MAQEQGKPLTEVVSAGVGLAFVTLPAAINLLPAPYILGPLFFFALVVAGLSSHISIMEAVTSAVIDKLKWSRKKAANVVIGTGLWSQWHLQPMAVYFCLTLLTISQITSVLW